MITRLPFIIVLVSTAVFVTPEVNADLTADLVERCCILGTNWWRASGGRCTQYPHADLQLEDDLHEACLLLIDICCSQSRENDNCAVGRTVSYSTDSCDSVRVVRGDTEAFTHQKECCQCCQLGKFAASTSQSCEVFEVSGRICHDSPSCCDSFYTCCNSTGEVTYPGLETTTLPSTTTIDHFVEPVHTPGGICDRFSSALCEHYCHDAPDRDNKFRCSCRRGSELAPNLRNCVESDEAQTCETSNPCSDSSECYMRGGFPMCRCQPGYRLVSGTACEDVDECLQSIDNCRFSERCENIYGGFTCRQITCAQGQAYDPVSQRCVVSQTGSTSCERDEIYDHALRQCVSAFPIDQLCPQGYAFNVISNTCEDLDECVSDLLHDCTSSSECINVQGTFLCECGPGLIINPMTGECRDLDECALGQDTCDRGQRCENTIGSFACRRQVSCGTGYTLQESTQACVDINECALGSHSCGPAFTCQNMPGSFRCQYKECPPGQRLNLGTGECAGTTSCQTGFSWDEFSRRCQDVNECLTGTPCLPSERCVNVEGSYQCNSRARLQCSPGYEVNRQGNQCLDVDECSRNIHNCDSRAQCQNTQGSFQCRCSAGYQLQAVSNNCVDINECNSTLGQYCSPMTSNCVNSPGSFSCQCKEGFEQLRNSKACQDVNECLRPNMCDHTCHNVWGSFQCRCRPGFRLSEDKRSCQDVNECELASTRGRLCSGFCENTPGSFRCTCPPGYRLSNNGRECIDIDECNEGLAGCTGRDKVCINTRGSYKCNVATCPRYFALSSDSQSRNSVRCGRETFVCAQNDVECFTAPLSLSYNYLTLRSSRLRIPTELFTMRGPDSFKRIEFKLEVSRVENLDRNSIRVGDSNFRLHVDPSTSHEAVVSVDLPIQGQQDITLKLDMNLYNENGFFGTAVAYINIYATVDPWEDLES